MKLRKKTVSFIWILTWLLFSALLFASPALAHKVNLFAYVENGIVYTEGYFPDGRAVENGGIEVWDSHKKKLLEGKTDKKGKFSFPLPVKEDLTIVINASMGHKNTFTLKKSEME